MWRCVRLDAGQWVTVSENDSLEEVRSAATKAPDDSPTYYFTDEKPKNPADAMRIVRDVLTANNGRILRATLGAEIRPAPNKRDVTGCPGNCFCVVQGGSSRCETYYCNDFMCWWVPCGMGC